MFLLILGWSPSLRNFRRAVVEPMNRDGALGLPDRGLWAPRRHARRGPAIYNTNTRALPRIYTYPAYIFLSEEA